MDHGVDAAEEWLRESAVELQVQPVASEFAALCLAVDPGEENGFFGQLCVFGFIGRRG